MELRLPSEYQEVEYIENTGTQYIITDLLFPKDLENPKIEWGFMHIGSASGDNMVFGYTNRGAVYFEIYGYIEQIYGGTGQKRYKAIVDNNLAKNILITGLMTKESITLNGTSHTPNANYSLTQDVLPMAIFAWKTTNGVDYINKGARLYYLRFFNGNTKMADYVPCYRKSDGEIGMYDTVTKTFYTNSGTGTFLKGADITRYIDNVSVLDTRRKILLNTPHIDTSVGDLVTFNTDLSAPLKSCKVSFSPVQEGEGDPSPDNVRNITGWNGVSVGLPRLPSEYQKVEYIENSGKSYLKIPYTIQRYDEIETKLYTEKTGVSYQAPFSNGVATYQTIMIFAYDKSIYVKYFATGDAPKIMLENIKGIPLLFTIDSNGLLTCKNENNEILGTAQSLYQQNIDGEDTDLYLFIRANKKDPFYGRYYGFKITNNNNLCLNLIPCYRKSDNEIGMYDTVSKQFFTNQGTGTFLKGDDVGIQASIDWADSAGTVYGGYVDLVSGELVATHLAFVMDGVNHKVSTGAGVNTVNNMARGHAFMGRTGGLENLPLGKNNSGLYAINKYVIHGMENGAGKTAVEGVYCGTGTPYVRVVVCADDLADVSGANAIINSINEWLTNNPVQICYTLAEPIHYQLTPQQILTLKGTNNVYSNTNGQTEIKYWTH